MSNPRQPPSPSSQTGSLFSWAGVSLEPATEATSPRRKLTNQNTPALREEPPQAGFPRYPRYKDSGVEWLGQVPEHWEVVPLSRVTKSRCDGPFGSGLKSEHYTDYGVRVIRLQNIRQDGFSGGDEAFIDPGYYQQELGGHDVIAGDVLIAGLGDDNNRVGRACVAPRGIEPAMVKADCFRFRLEPQRVMPEFVATVLSAGAAADGGILASGSTRSRIPLSLMATRRIVAPPLPEQHAIVAFLDRETAKIDALVAEQERLIELLKEKRQAVISHAVTRGLDPGAPMKDSGVEWLGQVPAHWEVKRLKHIVASLEQGWSPQCDGFPAETEHDWAVLKVGCVNGGTFRPSENKALPSELVPIPALAVLAGDLLISRANTRELVGSAAVVPRDFYRLMLCDKLYRLRFLPGCASSWYVALHLGSSAVRGQIELAATGASDSMLNITQSAILELPIALPPSAEQAFIVGEVATSLARLDALTTEAERAIELLQERRTALVSAAVTGQIDVRDADRRSE